MLLGALLFVLGFTVVFIGVTVTASAGGALLRHQELFTRLAGVAVALLGLVFIGWSPLGERRWQPSWRPAAGLVGAPMLGAVFAVGWAPCSSPTLGAVLLLATSDGGGVGRGVVLATAYSVGLGVPFLLVAAAYGRASRVLAVLSRHQRGLQVGGGVMLVVLGLLMASGLWLALITRLQSAILGYEVAV